MQGRRYKSTVFQHFSICIFSYRLSSFFIYHVPFRCVLQARRNNADDKYILKSLVWRAIGRPAVRLLKVFCSDIKNGWDFVDIMYAGLLRLLDVFFLLILFKVHAADAAKYIGIVLYFSSFFSKLTNALLSRSPLPLPFYSNIIALSFQLWKFWNYRQNDPFVLPRIYFTSIIKVYRKTNDSIKISWRGSINSVRRSIPKFLPQSI